MKSGQMISLFLSVFPSLSEACSTGLGELLSDRLNLPVDRLKLYADSV